MNNIKSNILWITRTAMFIALLTALHAATQPLGNQFITGSVVNLVLIVSVMTCGLASGAVVAVFSPVIAFILPFPIGPQLPLIIPFVCLGNVALVVIWHFTGNRNFGNKYIALVAALIAGAVGKFAVLYFGVVRFVAPLVLGLPETAPVYILFSYPQLITASIGGFLAILLLPVIKKAIKTGS